MYMSNYHLLRCQCGKVVHGPQYCDEVSYGFDRLYENMIQLAKSQMMMQHGEPPIHDIKRNSHITTSKILKSNVQQEKRYRNEIESNEQVDGDTDDDSEYSHKSSAISASDEDSEYESEPDLKPKIKADVKRARLNKENTKPTKQKPSVAILKKNVPKALISSAEGNTNISIRAFDWTKRVVIPKTLVSFKNNRYIFLKPLAKIKSKMEGKAYAMFADAAQVAPNILESIYPATTKGTMNIWNALGYYPEKVHLKSGPNSCKCAGCSREFEVGGWARELAYPHMASSNRGTVIRLHVQKAVTIMSDILKELPRATDLQAADEVVDLTQCYCDKFFQKTVAIRSIMDIMTTIHGGFIVDNALRLRVVSSGLAREEVGRRLVENHMIDPVRQHHIEPTRHFFKLLDDAPDPETGKLSTERSREYFLRCGTQLFETDQLDPAVWEELLCPHKRFGHPGSMGAILMCRAFFEGRCPEPDEYDIDHYDYLTNSLKGNGTSS